MLDECEARIAQGHLTRCFSHVLRCMGLVTGLADIQGSLQTFQKAVIKREIRESGVGENFRRVAASKLRHGSSLALAAQSAHSYQANGSGLMEMLSEGMQRTRQPPESSTTAAGPSYNTERPTSA